MAEEKQNKTKSFTCPTCGIEFGAEKAYQDHLKTHETQTSSTNPNPHNLSGGTSPVPASSDLIEPASRPANVDPNDPIAAKIAEYDEAIKKANELNAKLEAQYKENSEKFKSGFKGMSVQEQATIIEAHKSDAERMRENLAKQEKVQIFVPLDGKEKLGTQLPVTLDGYRVNVPKGVYCKVPEQVAQLIMDSLNQTQEALNNPLNMDNAEPEKQTALG